MHTLICVTFTLLLVALPGRFCLRCFIQLIYYLRYQRSSNEASAFLKTVRVLSWCKWLSTAPGRSASSIDEVLGGCRSMSSCLFLPLRQANNTRSTLQWRKAAGELTEATQNSSGTSSLWIWHMALTACKWRQGTWRRSLTKSTKEARSETEPRSRLSQIRCTLILLRTRTCRWFKQMQMYSRVSPGNWFRASGHWTRFKPVGGRESSRQVWDCWTNHLWLIGPSRSSRALLPSLVWRSTWRVFHSPVRSPLGKLCWRGLQAGDLYLETRWGCSLLSLRLSGWPAAGSCFWCRFPPTAWSGDLPMRGSSGGPMLSPAFTLRRSLPQFVSAISPGQVRWWLSLPLSNSVPGFGNV